MSVLRKLHFLTFGNVQIFQPSRFGQEFVRRRARTHLLSLYSPGTYLGRNDVNAIIQHQYRFYESLLAIVMPKLTSRDAAEFLLFQFDEAVRIIHGEGILDLRERQVWKQIEPNFKRAIKILLELICMNSTGNPQKISSDEAVFALETAFVCAESMVSLSQESDLTYSIFPENCELRIFDDGPLDFKITLCGRSMGWDEEFSERVIRDRRSRGRFVPVQMDYHTAAQQPYLDKAFEASFGMSYGEFVAAIRAVIDQTRPSLHPNNFPTLFVRRTDVIDALCESGRCRPAIERAIDGFTVSPAGMKLEGRAVWRPKQKSRAYRRGFFLLPHDSGAHLAFSQSMARENMIQLVNWVPYQHLPGEWESPLVRKALGELANGVGAWFETMVANNLRLLGIVGGRVRQTIKSSDGKLRIPDEVGEIDFLGYQSRDGLLVIVEAKMVMTGLEPCYWRDDLDTFVYRNGSYAERFRKKLGWVKENRDEISRILGAKTSLKIAFAMLTLYPCIARAFIEDFQCVSLSEFMLDYERESAWPYVLV